jgi:uncharacterized protein YjdB
MKKAITLSLLALLFSFASYALFPMSPSSGEICIGYSLFLTDSLSLGGTWSGGDPSVATIDATTGELSGVAMGVVDITYTLGTSYVTGSFTVNASPAPISGGTVTICAGSTTTLTDATPGGTWSTYYYYVSVGSSSGIVTGLYGGVAIIDYAVGGCSVSAMVTVDATSTGAIVGLATVCAGSTMTLIDSLGLGGSWSSSNPAVATIGATTGILSGLSVGTVTISYTTSGPCGTSVVTSIISVINTTSTGLFYGAGTITLGYTGAFMYNTVPGGTWTSGAPSIATIDPVTGAVSGLSIGIAPITYTVTGCGGTASGYTSLIVNALDGISGIINFTSGPYSGPVKIWLITYNPITHDLQASDSIAAYYTGTSIYYQFTGLATDSFRIKAAPNDTLTLTAGYMPTYHTSQFYWHDADVIYHTAGGTDLHKDINMSIGIPTSGPGFIAGDVFTGANKGTAGGAPAKNLCMYAVNASTGQLIEKTNTNNSGHYNFTNLPLGTYRVFPDSLNYLTTAFNSITLTTANPGMTAASFMQHTISHTITPLPSAVSTVTPIVSSVFTFPNPANNKLTIQWTELAAETGHVAISDITGRELYSSVINMQQGTGVKQIDLSTFANGLYLVTVKTGTISYTNKLQIQH